MGLLEASELDAFQDQHLASQGLEIAANVEAIARGFQDQGVGVCGVLADPAIELTERNLEKGLLKDRCPRRGALDQCRCKTVGVDVQTDDPLDRS